MKPLLMVLAAILTCAASPAAAQDTPLPEVKIKCNCSPPVEAVQASCFLIMLAASPARAIWMATRGL